MNRIKPFWYGLAAFTIINILAIFLNLGISSRFLNLSNDFVPVGTNSAAMVPTATEIPMMYVVIAVQDIPRGTVISPDRVAVIVMPAVNVPGGALSRREDVVGYIAATDIYTEEVILARKLVYDLNALGSTGSDMTAMLEPNRVAITVYLPIQQVPLGLAVGDRVDLIVSMQFIRLDSDFQTTYPNNISLLSENAEGETVVVLDASGRIELLPPLGEVVSEPSEAQRPRLVTQRSVTDAQVIGLGDVPISGSIDNTGNVAGTETPVTISADGNGEIAVTLAVSPQDAVFIVWAQQAELPITLVARSARSQGLADTNPVTLDWIMQNYNVALPSENEYGLEPIAEATVEP